MLAGSIDADVQQGCKHICEPRPFVLSACLIANRPGDLIITAASY